MRSLMKPVLEYSPSVVRLNVQTLSFLYSTAPSDLPLKFYVNTMAKFIGEEVPCNSTNCYQQCQSSDALTGELDL